ATPPEAPGPAPRRHGAPPGPRGRSAPSGGTPAVGTAPLSPAEPPAHSREPGPGGGPAPDTPRPADGTDAPLPRPEGDGPAGPPPPGRVPGGSGAAEPGVRLRARRLTVRYAGFTALDRVDLDLPVGRITALVGPNGAGKSTLFHCLAGTIRPAAGQVTLDGADITRRPAHARTRLGIARTFQELAVFPSLTVEDNVRIGAEQGRVRSSPGPDTEQVLRLLGLSGGLRARPAAGLSTGTLRRVELGRALAGRPHALLLDEPAAGLDAAETAALARVLRALAADGMAVLVVEHDPDLVAAIAHTVHVMEAGRIVTRS
ncbi:ATP-binding cassette domain-containing protein, partial [Streptomyces sp. MUM 203J]|uniref:ABC transporter ATP-binding protein n=1 Tax=Streptomyces sp. MUM 203J TaxID=2791990 RepID=UPI001F04EEF4